MSKIKLYTTGEPTTPNLGSILIYADQTDKHLKTKDSTGAVVDLTETLTPPAIVGGSNVSVVSGTSTITISASVPGAGTPNALIGVQGITIISGTNTTTVSGFRLEFVSASGFLQTQIDTANADVASLNGLQGALTIAGTGNLNVSAVGSTITLVPPVAPAIVAGSNITVISGANTTQISAIVNTTNAIIGDSFISVISGSNTTRLTADAIIAGSSNLTIASGITFVQLDLGTTVTGLTSIQATTVTGTTGQFAGTVSTQNISASNSLTISGTPVMHVGVHGVTISGSTETTGPVLNLIGSRALNVSRSGNTVTFDAPPPTIINSAIASFQFFADQLSTPLETDWAVNAFAPLTIDTLNSGIVHRAFDDTTEEGVGFSLELPQGTSNVTFKFRSRAQTTPAGTRTVGVKLYNRTIPPNAAVTSWTSNTLTDLSFPTNTNWQYADQTLTTGTLGVVGGRLCQFELTRINPASGTELTGDWNLMLLTVETN